MEYALSINGDVFVLAGRDGLRVDVIEAGELDAFGRVHLTVQRPTDSNIAIALGFPNRWNGEVLWHNTPPPPCPRCAIDPKDCGDHR